MLRASGRPRTSGAPRSRSTGPEEIAAEVACGRPGPPGWPRNLRAGPRLRQRTRLRRPMPGSIRIATAPALKMANVRAMKSIPGRTNRASRAPAGTPHSRSPRGNAVALLVELAEADLPVLPFPPAIVPQRLDHGDTLGHELGPWPSAGRQRSSWRDSWSRILPGSARHSHRARAAPATQSRGFSIPWPLVPSPPPFPPGRGKRTK